MTAPLATQDFTIAFAGNPNVGKSALINALSGSHLKVGNWPGVTVEKKEATLNYQQKSLKLIDLPGTYSLSPYTIEEQVCRDFLLRDTPDLIVNVIDTSNLSKSLYLTWQLIEMEIPMVLALNMWDEFESLGYELDLINLSEKLQIPLVKTVGLSGIGIEELKAVILEQAQNPRVPHMRHLPPAIENELAKLQVSLKNQAFAQGLPQRWLALRLLEQDPYSLKKIQELHRFDASDLARPHLANLQSLYPDLERNLTQLRQQEIEELVMQCVSQPRGQKLNKTDLIDQILLNDWLGIPAFLAILFGVFKLTFDISTPFIDWIDGFFNGFIGRWTALSLESFNTPPLIISLVKDGLIGGVGLVLTFVPLLMFLYLFLALLEESGYMARAAFLMDRFMFRFGLHGKSFVPLLVGFGCNVPGVYATRALENDADRRLTTAVMSFMSCGAKLPIYALFTAAFFQQHQAWVIMALYITGITVAISWSIILRRTRFKSEIPAFIMELPPYRLPRMAMLWHSIWGKTKAFIQQAGTVIAVSMLLLWSLVNLPYGAPPDQTVLGQSAKIVAPLFLPQGFGNRWEAVASILPGFMAKEMVVGTLGVVLSVQQNSKSTQNADFGKELWEQTMALKDATVTAGSAVISSVLPTPLVMTPEAPDSPLMRKVRESFTPLSAFSFMVFNLLLISCISVVGAMVHEFGGSYFGFVFMITTGTAYIASALVYQIGRLLGFS